MIKLEILRQDGSIAVQSEWRESDAKRMSAYRMRWLGPRGCRGYWVRTTDADGRVRTYGAVPEGQEAPGGQYVVREVQADGSDGITVKSFGTAKARAINYRLSHRLGGSPELVVRWVTDAGDREAEDRAVGWLLRLRQLQAEGKSFDEALAQANAEAEPE